MKVNIDKTIEVPDEARSQIADVLDQKVSKRPATRDEMKEFLWAHGASWESDLDQQHSDLTGADREEPEAEVEEDLIGGDDDLIGDTEVLGGDDVDELI